MGEVIVLASVDISNNLKAIVSSLCTKTRGSQERRLFQLKYWLLDDDPNDLHTFDRADRLFAFLEMASSIHLEMKNARRDHEDPSAAKAIENLLSEDEDFRTMVNRSFTPNAGFPSLGDLEALSEKVKDKTYKQRVLSVNKFTVMSIRARITGSKSVMTDAQKHYALEVSRNPGKLLHNIEHLRTIRRQRLPFLLVAQSNAFGDILEFPQSSTAMRSLLKSQAYDFERFRRFFAYCAYVQGTSARGRECKQGDIERWAGRRAKPPSYKAFTAEEIAAAESHHIMALAGDS